MASSISPLTSPPAPSGTAAAGSGSASTAATNPVNEQVFLQLLVAQMKNQDPMNPTDGTQFVSQLAQFSELEQVIAIRGDIEKGSTPSTQSTTSDTPSTAETQL